MFTEEDGTTINNKDCIKHINIYSTLYLQPQVFQTGDFLNVLLRFYGF